MDRYLDFTLAEQYHSESQRVRVLSEAWTRHNAYCPWCQCAGLEQCPNNEPVADFVCPQCHNIFELKSLKKSTPNRITDGAYRTMIERIQSSTNPDFFFLDYNPCTLEIKNFIFIPKYFFVPEIIEKRPPLSPTARRAGWVGCNILFNQIPDYGRIFIIKEGTEIPSYQVHHLLQQTSFLNSTSVVTRGWLLDVLNCVQQIPTPIFSLSDVYEFGAELSKKHPKNRHISEKIRQQLQILRDENLLSFLGKGLYRKNFTSRPEIM